MGRDQRGAKGEKLQMKARVERRERARVGQRPGWTEGQDRPSELGGGPSRLAAALLPEPEVTGTSNVPCARPVRGKSSLRVGGLFGGPGSETHGALGLTQSHAKRLTLSDMNS